MSTTALKTSKPLEPFERETIIRFDRLDKSAFVFTYERTWQTHCEKVLGLSPILVNAHGGKEYELPKSWIRKPRRSRRKKEVT